MIKNQLKNRLERSNKLYLDLIAHIPESLLGSKLRDLPSNTIGSQIWCVVGARDSYLRAAKAGQWQGFKCPLEGSKTTEAKAVSELLMNTGEQINIFMSEPGELSEDALKFVLDLLEHESQHHGQLARYLYGLKVGVPQSWKDRYHFD
jgi:hypothetical protein